MENIHRLDQIVVCKLCAALTTYDDRARHIEWHARLNARTLQPRDVDTNERIERVQPLPL